MRKREKYEAKNGKRESLVESLVLGQVSRLEKQIDLLTYPLFEVSLEVYDLYLDSLEVYDLYLDSLELSQLMAARHLLLYLHA